MARIRPAALLVLALLGDAAAEEPRLSRSYYPVTGLDRIGLTAAVAANAPRGGKAYGLTFIDFHPRWRTRAKAGSCALSDVTVGLTVHMRLPRWGGGPRQPPAAARRFVGAIERHELGHVAIARRFAAGMRQALQRLPAEASCAALAIRAGRLAEDWRRRHLAAQRAYDARERKGLARLL